MHVYQLNLEYVDPKLTQIVINGLKKIAIDCMLEVAEISRNYYSQEGEIVPHKDVMRLSDIVATLAQVTEQIENAENSLKSDED
jgi:hypothetical protein